MSIQTSEKHLCNALLCQNCFDIREEYRKPHPINRNKKAETNIFGDQYGKNRWFKAVVCAACDNTYELVPSDYVDVSLEEQKSHYDQAIVFHKGRKPFAPIMFNYEYAPKGWTNEILCKSCFDNIQGGCENEIRQMHEHETERLRIEAIHKAKEEIQRKRNDEVFMNEDRSFLSLMVIIFLIFAIPMFLSMCTGSISGDNDPTDLYYRR
jgi:hypothetical protein